MPVTDSLKVWAIGGRTDSTGSLTTDVDQEEFRIFPAAMMRAGLLPNLLNGTPNLNAFRVRQNLGTDMNVLVGSGTSGVDGIILRSTSTVGQGAYIARLDAVTATVSVPATDATNPARYGVFAFINDATYGGTASRSFVGLSCIRGTPAAVPTTPGPLAAWSASFLLWEFQLAALATAVTNSILDTAATGIDQRVTANPIVQTWLEGQVFS